MTSSRLTNDPSADRTSPPPTLPRSDPSESGAVTNLRFVDVFAGCGGLSLGLMSAGLHGIFAVEQDELAFGTLSHNLIDEHAFSPLVYRWPDWLPKEPIEITKFIDGHRADLENLRGRIDLVAGGPPCQGFSLAGRRKCNDPRNRLFKHYLELVALLAPSFVLLENVRGISVAFRKRMKGNGVTAKPAEPFSEQIARELGKIGYNVFTKLIRGTDVGVPQFRPRYILLAIREDLLKRAPTVDPFEDFERHRKDFLKRKGLPTTIPVTVAQAISDLEIASTKLTECVDSSGFSQIRYKGPRTKFQRLLHGKLNGTAPNSLRLANHRDRTRERFAKIIATCRQGVQLSVADRKRFNLKKHCVVPLHPKRPSHTLTTLPDDFLHYSEPRILTVREYARLQSFPDWYAFKGKYTTGGDRRLRECPRYTQAGNAVPPFLAEFVGELIVRLQARLCSIREL
jgi:DNA (cytosine-5)-methyltransferase 1